MILPNPNPDVAFGLELIQHIGSSALQAGDILIFDSNQEPAPGDIGIIWIGERWLLVNLYPVDQNPDTPWYTMSKESNPEALQELREAGYVYWWPIAIGEETEDYFIGLVNQNEITWTPLAPEEVAAVAVQLERTMAM